MTHLKGRLLGIVIILVFATLMYVNWQQLTTAGTYSIKMATMVPVGLVGGLFILVFPAKAGKPTTTRDKILVLIVFAVGILAGLANWYLMDPGYFGQ